MRRAILAAAALALMAPELAHAEHFDIKLVAAGPDGVAQQAFADQTPPEGGLNPRPVLKVRAGDEITMQFIMTNVYPHGTAANAGVHYYVVRERDLGQKAVPAVSEEAIVDGTFTFALKPGVLIRERM